MKITLDSEAVFHYLTNRPKQDISEEKWKQDGSEPLNFPVTVSLGGMELPLPLSTASFQFYGTGKHYSGRAVISTRQAIGLQSLSKQLRTNFSEESGYLWAPLRPRGFESYIYENTGEPTFAINCGTNAKTNLPVFLIFMGSNGARMRTLDSEAALVEEVGTFGLVTSKFLDSCISLRKSRASSRAPIVLPSHLELSCMNVSYG